MLAYIRWSLCIRHGSKYFTHMNSFNSHSVSIKWILLLSPFLRFRNWGSEKLRDWPKVSHLMRVQPMEVLKPLYCLLFLKWICNSTQYFLFLMKPPHYSPNDLFKMLFSLLKYTKGSPMSMWFLQIPFMVWLPFLNFLVSWHTIYASEIPKVLTIL